MTTISHALIYGSMDQLSVADGRLVNDIAALKRRIGHDRIRVRDGNRAQETSPHDTLCGAAQQRLPCGEITVSRSQECPGVR